MRGHWWRKRQYFPLPVFMLKLLLDENIGPFVARELRSVGYDVKSVLEECPGFSDEVVLALAKEEERILVTLDRDFGRLVFLNSRKHVGVVYLRLTLETSEEIFAFLTRVLEERRDDIPNHFVTVSNSGVRVR